MGKEERHRANALVPRELEPIRVYRRNIPGLRWAISNIVLEHYCILIVSVGVEGVSIQADFKPATLIAGSCCLNQRKIDIYLQKTSGKHEMRRNINIVEKVKANCGHHQQFAT